jgi:hypothetical protein
VSRPAASILDILNNEVASERPKARLDPEAAHLFVVCLERLQAFRDHALRKEAEFRTAKNVTERWRFHGFAEGTELGQQELKSIFMRLLEVDDPHVATAVMRRMAQGR